MSQRAIKWARTAARQRRQVARLISEYDVAPARPDAWMHVHRPDLARVRRAAEDMVALTDKLLAGHDMFADWCRARGCPPETPGWPRECAREWATKAKGDRRIAMAQSMRRQGQRLLDTLDGRCPWAPSAPPMAEAKPCPSCPTVEIEELTVEAVFGEDRESYLAENISVQGGAVITVQCSDRRPPDILRFMARVVGPEGTAIQTSLGGRVRSSSWVSSGVPSFFGDVRGRPNNAQLRLSVERLPCAVCGVSQARSSVPPVEVPAFIWRRAADIAVHIDDDEWPWWLSALGVEIDDALQWARLHVDESVDDGELWKATRVERRGAMTSELPYGVVLTVDGVPRTIEVAPPGADIARLTTEQILGRLQADPIHGGRFSMAADGSIQVSLGLSTCTVEIDRG